MAVQFELPEAAPECACTDDLNLSSGTEQHLHRTPQMKTRWAFDPLISVQMLTIPSPSNMDNH